MSTPQPPAGWYPDQVNPQLVRWWDGHMWTHHVQPAQPPAPLQPGGFPNASFVTPGVTNDALGQPPRPPQRHEQQPQQAAAGGGPGVGPMFADQQLQVIQDARAWGIFEKAAYQVIGQGGQPIGTIQQVEPQPEQGRSEHFQVLDPGGAVVFRVSRPLEMKSAHRPRFEVTFPDGRPLGVIESEKLVGRITFGFTVNGVRLAGVKAEGMHNRRFALTDQHDQQFAQYDREPPRGQRDDSYVITRYRPTPEPLGTFVLAGVIVLDAAFFVASVGGPLR